jgi:GTP diphosphokinase / guanosine-3',5'-bis(diphosphate) 3'-diphosphatase
MTAPEIQQTLDAIVDKVRAYHPDPDVAVLYKAFDLARNMHADQRRRSGDLYLSHPLAVTSIIADLKLDVPSLCAGILHDIVEDTEVSVVDIERDYGAEIAFIVDGVTKLSKYAFNTREERQAESFRKMLIAMSADLRVILVKLADRLHNMRTLSHMPADKQRYIAKETLDIYAPLANRLGISWIKSELEDESFKYLYPEDYTALTEKVDKKKTERDKFITETITLLSEAVREKDIPCEVSGRSKHFYSIWRKMRNNNIEFDQVYDALAFRIITDTTGRCYEVLGLVHSLWKPVPGRFKDYVAMPKPNGYQSLHTSVLGPYQERVEIQIRTRQMHQIAEYGVAAHWQYKEGRAVSPDADKFAWLRQLVEWQQELPDSQEFMETVTQDLFGEEVYALTPRGDVKTMRKGATPVDFAYAIHTEVGHHCIGARVNGAMVPLKTKLRTGDIVEILTSPNGKPSKDWLDFAVTSRARTKIRQHVRAAERDRARQIGRAALDKALRRHSLKIKKLERNGQLRKAIEGTKLPSIEELYVQLGFGRFQTDTIIKRLVPDAKPKEEEDEEGTLSKFINRFTQRNEKPGIALDGVDDILVRYAKCCRPVPGEDIVGFVTRGRGLSIHSALCNKYKNLEQERMVDVYWRADKQARLPVLIRVMCADQSGMLAAISAVFSASGVNIAEAHCRTNKDGGATLTFQVLVADAGQLKDALRTIRGLKGIYSVDRVRA